MPCKKCNGYWQCSKVDLPCGVSATPIETQVHCFVVKTKKANDKCMMLVQASEAGTDPQQPENDGWNDAGEICFRFQLFESEDGECVVKAEPV